MPGQAPAATAELAAYEKGRPLAADRETAEKILTVWPSGRASMRENRAFLGRAVRYLTGDVGIRQFLDIGAGLPTTGNVHEVAQGIAPSSRVVYVDNDPLVLAHARALLNSGAEGRTPHAGRGQLVRRGRQEALMSPILRGDTRPVVLPEVDRLKVGCLAEARRGLEGGAWLFGESPTAGRRRAGSDVLRAKVITAVHERNPGVMASIRHEIVIDAPPEHVWDVLRDVGAVHERLLPGRVTGCRLEGDQRFLTFPDGHVIRELIVAVVDDARRLAYSVAEGARPPIEYHHASFEVRSEGGSAGRLIRITDVLPHTLAAGIRIRMQRGAMEMKEAIEAAARLNHRSAH